MVAEQSLAAANPPPGYESRQPMRDLARWYRWALVEMRYEEAVCERAARAGRAAEARGVPAEQARDVAARVARGDRFVSAGIPLLHSLRPASAPLLLGGVGLGLELIRHAPGLAILPVIGLLSMAAARPPGTILPAGPRLAEHRRAMAAGLAVDVISLAAIVTGILPHLLRS